MSESFSQLYQALTEWSEQASESGWISRRQLEQLTTIETQEADALFSASGQRPLIVAFFGGTGVGKSTLLNRLAGDTIARTGVKRPTSQEVTLYIHKDFEVRELPPELPEKETVIAYHQDDSRRLVAWLDLPDFDSTESAHRDQVVKWLPYIDWVIYVVSPERYHDDIGWRFLQQRQSSHSWLFIINHWDEGRPEQRQDFRNRLQAEGFDDPTIITTDCGDGSKLDEFPILESTINDSIRQFGLSFLQSLGGQARIRELSSLGQRFAEQLGSDKQWASLAPQWQQTADEQLDKVQHRLLSGVDSGTRPIIAEERAKQGFLKRKAPSSKGLSSAADRLVDSLSQQMSEQSTEDLRLSLQQRLRAEGLPDEASERHLSDWQSQTGHSLKSHLQQAVSAALGAPGTPNQRRFFKLFRTLMWLLPLAASGWAAYVVVKAFYLGTLGQQDFLGINFAVNSLLMIGLGWLAPWIIQLQLRPSPAKTMQLAMTQAVRSAVAEMKTSLNETFEEIQNVGRNQRERLASVQNDILAALE